MSENSEKEFEGYLEYLNRSKAKQESNKSDLGLFTDNSNGLSAEQRNEMTKKFQTAQENGSVLWRDVFSFDNNWLKENGFLNDNQLNEKAVKDATREAMKKCFEKEGIKDNGFWVGEIHYNTDNIHVHVASTELENTRDIISYQRYRKDGSKYTVEEPKGKRKKTTEDQMKSTFINSLVDRDQQLEKISNLRYSLHHSIKINPESIKQNEMLKNIRANLPEDISKWQYNNKEMKKLQPMIDQYTNNYMNQYHKEEFDEYKKLIKEDAEFNKSLYGEGDKEKGKYKNSEEFKMKDLNAKMGNALLKQLKEKELHQREIDKKLVDGKKSSRESYKDNKNFTAKDYAKRIPGMTKYDLYKMKNAFNNHKRQRELDIEHQKLEEKIRAQKEYENEL